MTWGFEVGRVYNRRIDIHGRFGGQQQGGIVTPALAPASVSCPEVIAQYSLHLTLSFMLVGLLPLCPNRFGAHERRR